MSYHHSVYGPNRHCRVCKQHFGSVPALKFHTLSHKCPGEPVHYSSTTGRLFYRGDNMGSFCSADLFPRTRHNSLICRGPPYDRYVVPVKASEPFKSIEKVNQIRADLEPNLYKERIYNPRYPRVLEGTPVRVGPEDPKNRDDLNALCGNRRRSFRRERHMHDQRALDHGMWWKLSIMCNVDLICVSRASQSPLSRHNSPNYIILIYRYPSYRCDWFTSFEWRFSITVFGHPSNVSFKHLGLHWWSLNLR